MSARSPEGGPHVVLPRRHSGTAIVFTAITSPIVSGFPEDDQSDQNSDSDDAKDDEPGAHRTRRLERLRERGCHIDHAVRKAPLVVVPAHDGDKAVVDDL